MLLGYFNEVRMKRIKRYALAFFKWMLLGILIGMC